MALTLPKVLGGAHGVRATELCQNPPQSPDTTKSVSHLSVVGPRTSTMYSGRNACPARHGAGSIWREIVVKWARIWITVVFLLVVSDCLPSRQFRVSLDMERTNSQAALRFKPCGNDLDVEVRCSALVGSYPIGLGVRELSLSLDLQNRTKRELRFDCNRVLLMSCGGASQEGDSARTLGISRSSADILRIPPGKKRHAYVEFAVTQNDTALYDYTLPKCLLLGKVMREDTSALCSIPEVYLFEVVK